MPLSENMRGAALMSASMVAFTLNDLCMKALSATLPLFQAIFLRGCGTSLALLGLTAVLGQLRFDLPPGDRRLILWRTLAEIAAAFFFLNAVFNMPIGNATAILQSLPLAVTLAAALVLREPVGWRRLSAIAVGFLGVLLIVRPGAEGFTAYSLSALAAVACVTVRDLTARRISTQTPSVLVGLVAAVAVTLVSGVASVFQDWAPVGPSQLWGLGGAMFFIIGGYVFSVAAMRVGEIGFVAPFRYTALVAAMILGGVFFGERPDMLTLLGAAIIVATGLFTLYRERQAAQPRPQAGS